MKLDKTFIFVTVTYSFELFSDISLGLWRDRRRSNFENRRMEKILNYYQTFWEIILINHLCDSMGLEFIVNIPYLTAHCI